MPESMSDIMGLLPAVVVGAASVILYNYLSRPKTPELAGLKHVYFPVAARGDAARLCMALKKIPFEDERIMPADWGALKPTTPWGSMPYVVLADGTLLGQSYAILRFIGKGTGLYPKDALKALYVDECMDGLNDVGRSTNTTGQGLALEEKIAKRGAACKKDGDIYVTYQRVEALYERANKGFTSPFLTGELTIADLQLFAQIGWATSGFFDGVSAGFLSDFPRIQAVRKAVISIPEVAAWYEAELKQSYMDAVVGGHPAKECYTNMIMSSKTA